MASATPAVYIEIICISTSFINQISYGMIWISGRPIILPMLPSDNSYYCLTHHVVQFFYSRLLLWLVMTSGTPLNIKYAHEPNISRRCSSLICRQASTAYEYVALLNNNRAPHTHILIHNNRTLSRRLLHAYG